MALTKFDPDPDLFDPNDPDSWYGTWHHDDGSSLYGQGTPEMGEPLLAANDATASNDGPPDALASYDPDEEQLDAGSPLQSLERPQQSSAQPPASAAPPPVAPPRAAAPQEAAKASGGAWEDDVPPQVANALNQQASAAGLSPGSLAAVIKHESGWDPSRGSGGDAGKDTHAGLIQFSKNLWPGVAAAAGRPDVSFEEMRGMSAEDQVPFVVAYYKGKGLTPDSKEGDYRLATYKPKYLKEGDDFVLDDAKEAKGIKVTPENARLDKNADGVINSYEQNAGLDTNQDGHITAGEVRQGPRGTQSGAAAAQPTGLPPTAPGVPSSFGGLPMSAVTMSGTPHSPEQIQQAQQNVAQRYAATIGAHQQADELRAQGARDAMTLVQQNHDQQTADIAAETARRAGIKKQAEDKITQEVTAPIQQIDPKRFLKNMSTGDKVMGAIAVVLSTIGQTADRMMGIASGNSALTVLNAALDQDVDNQKEALARGDRQSAQRLAHWQKVLGDQDSALDALKAEGKMAAASMLQARVQGGQLDANAKAQGLEFAANMFSEGQAAIQAITDREDQRMQVQYAPPKAVKADPDKLVKTLQAAKEARQELVATGQYTPAQIDQILTANNLPTAASQGETVPQQTARQGVEREQDEKTSKELEDIGTAEASVRTVQERLDKLAKSPLVKESLYKPEMGGGTGFFGGLKTLASNVTPGIPGGGDVNAFLQSFEDLVLKKGKALSGATISDEAAEKIRQTLMGAGSITDIRRGLTDTLKELELKRGYSSTRRGSSAQRLNTRLQDEGPRPVTGPVQVGGKR